VAWVVLFLSLWVTVAAAAATGAERRSLRDWGKLNDKALQELEEEWLEDEEEDPDDESFKWRRGPNGERIPPEPKGPKMEMGFATLTPGTKKSECETIASRWTQLLSTDAVPVKAYAIEDDKLLLGVEGGFVDMIKVKEFVLDQPEAIEFEWQQQKFKPRSKTGRGAQSTAALTDEEKRANERAEKELEIRRKLESGELFANMPPPPHAAQHAAQHAADANAKTKSKSNIQPNPKTNNKPAKPASNSKPKPKKDEL